MPVPKTLQLDTDLFIGHWAEAMKKERTWDQFVQAIIDDNGSKGISNTHDAYFAGPKGVATFTKFWKRYVAWKENQDDPLGKSAKPSDYTDEVRFFVVSEAALAKCNALRSNKDFGKARRPSGWKNRVGKMTGGGREAADWGSRKNLMAGFFEKS